MTTIVSFIKRHPVAAYFALAFAISWSGAVLILGPGAFLGTTEISLVEVSPFAYLPFLAGPSLAGILLAGLVHGRAGLRTIRSRLLRWRVGVRWYVIALLTAPFVTMATQFALSLTSPVFLPGIITASDKISLLLSGIGVGLVVSFFEELGWTGFATPELRKRHGILATGLSVGLLWGAWHFPVFSGSASSSEAIPPALYVAVLLFSWVVPYRVLMVWLYDRTGSLLVAMLMHLPLDVGAFVLRPEAISGVAQVTHLLVYAATLWALVGAVAVANQGQLSRQPLKTRVT